MGTNISKDKGALCYFSLMNYFGLPLIYFSTIVKDVRFIFYAQTG